MKKQFMFLLLGVLGLCSTSIAQPPPFGLTGVMVNTGPGGSMVPVVAGQALPIGTVITFDGVTFAIRPTPAPNNQIPTAENVAFSFGFNNVVVDLNANGANNTVGLNANGDAFFGTSINDFTVVAVPFDLGLSAVLGAGAIAAVKARRRRKELEVIA